MTRPLQGIATTIARWQVHHGRHGLPWQGTTDVYRIWLSEVMLQQTQVVTVTPYYQRFLDRFPDVDALARATLDDVMPYWAGLGYYSRARNLHACARHVAHTLGGRFPDTAAGLAQLPGIGRSTAASIAAFAWGERRAILDGNVRRVFSRYFAVRTPPGAATDRSLWDLAQGVIDADGERFDMRRYNQGLMDVGATVCTPRTPDCTACPLAEGCQARRLGLQGDLPLRRARKPVPRRECVMLVLQCQDRVLLQRQPPSGIWGGLWSLPRFDTEADMHHWLAARQPEVAMPAHCTGRLAPLDHVFTHFRLRIHPHHHHISHCAVRQPDCGTEAWHRLDDAHHAGLPAPVATLLGGLTDQAGR